MPHPHPFVGRKTELKQFESVLADPTPQAILIVGQQGMGKSMLARKFHDMALSHANTGGGSFVFKVRKDRSIGGTLEDVLAEAEQAANAAFGSLGFTGVRQGIWSGLISLIDATAIASLPVSLCVINPFSRRMQRGFMLRGL